MRSTNCKLALSDFNCKKIATSRHYCKIPIKSWANSSRKPKSKWSKRKMRCSMRRWLKTTLLSFEADVEVGWYDTCSYGVVVSTQDFESCVPSSTLGKSITFYSNFNNYLMKNQIKPAAPADLNFTSSLQVHSLSWDRDSHGLFDYDAKYLTQSKLQFQGCSYIATDDLYTLK